MRTRQDVMLDYAKLKKMRKCDLIALIEEIRDSIWIQGDKKEDTINKGLATGLRYIIEAAIPFCIHAYLREKDRYTNSTEWNGFTIGDVDLKKEAFDIEDRLELEKRKVKR